MKIEIEPPDKTYNTLLAEESRLRGYLGIVNKLKRLRSYGYAD